MDSGNRMQPRDYGEASQLSCDRESSGHRRRRKRARNRPMSTDVLSHFPANALPYGIPQKTTSATSEDRTVCTELKG